MSYSYHKDMMVPPERQNWVFVFGSNLQGIHGKGAALVARQAFGAMWGVGAGLAGRSYAIPTKYSPSRGMDYREVCAYVQGFKKVAAYRGREDGQKYWLTRVGCGLAGFTDEEMASAFLGAPENCHMPRDWEKFLSNGVDPQ